MLRREGYDGPIAMISADESVPYDRPNLSKDYLAGTAQEDWIPLRGHDFYREQQIDLVLGTRVTDVRVGDRKVLLENGSERPFETLLIATGADPVRLPIPGADVSRVYYLRTFADSRALVERAGGAKRVVVIGASFIGLEVAASLRHRGIAVDVVAPESRPLERVMGPEMGNFIQSLHESQGVVFHLVYPNPADKRDPIVEHLRAFAYGGAVSALRDPTHTLVKDSGVTVTPEAAVYAGGRIVYHGRIDDRYVDLGLERPAATVHDLADALTAVLAGRAVTHGVTQAVGCYISDFTR